MGFMGIASYMELYTFLLKYPTWADERYTLWPMLEGWIRLADGEGCVAYGQRSDPT